MTTARTILATALLLLAVYIVAMNFMSVVVSTRNKRRGIDRHSSMIPLISTIVTIGAYNVFPYSNPSWMFIIPIFDLSNWSLLWLPFYLILEFIRKRTTEQTGGGDDEKPAS